MKHEYMGPKLTQAEGFILGVGAKMFSCCGARCGVWIYLLALSNPKIKGLTVSVKPFLIPRVNRQKLSKRSSFRPFQKAIRRGRFL